ncbi:SH3 domain-containing protein [Amycolatopsis sp. cmx-11-51]|uniref:SH3 domain-containing protein n=1 Tax=unclassified Amycolatopsis TaxID=2618356 RepID=UPI0039E47A07
MAISKPVLFLGAGAALIVVVAISGQDRESSASSPTGCQVVVTADVLNARDTPGGQKIVGKYNKDAKIDAQPVVENGFRKIAEGKWVSAQYAAPVVGSQCGP